MSTREPLEALREALEKAVIVMRAEKLAATDTYPYRSTYWEPQGRGGAAIIQAEQALAASAEAARITPKEK